MFELKVREIIADVLGVDIEDVIDDADIIEDLEATSMQVLELIVAMENEFKVEISDEDVIKNRTVGQIVEYLTK